VKEAALQTPGSVKKEEEEVLHVPEQKTMVRQAVPLQSMDVHGGADIHLQPVQDLRAVGCPKEAVTLCGVCAGAGSCQDLWTHGERSPRWSRFAGRACDPMGDPHWSSLFLKDCTPWKGPTLGQFMKSCSPWEGLMMGQFMKDCLPWEQPHVGGGTECEESSPEEEEAAETMCDELTAIPFPHLAAPLGGGG